VTRRGSGAELLADALRGADVSHVFGVPGSQLVDPWHRLQREPAIRVVRGTSELTASFMANGYARASGRPAVLLSIGGPGLTWALSGLAEARLDSVPLVHLVTAAVPTRADGSPGLQAIPQAEIAGPVVKAVLAPAAPGDVPAAVAEALALACSGEPGPVLVELSPGALGGRGAARPTAVPEAPAAPAPDALTALAGRLAAARRPLLLCGQGAAGAAAAVTELAAGLRLPVLTTTSGRGAIPESHAWSLPSDVPGKVDALNAVVAASDLVVVLGAALTHNGSRGYGLRLDPGRLVRVDSSPEVLGRGPEASLSIEADVPAVVALLAPRLLELGGSSEWRDDDVERHRARLAAEVPPHMRPGLGGVGAAELFATVRRLLPATNVVTTDSGLHQYMARAHHRVLAPRTFVVPSDFQSMGFGIPAAIGAALATGEHAVAIVGDGGLVMVGLELATAVRERVPLTVLVLVDGSLGLIRHSQLAGTGRDDGLDVVCPDLAAFAGSLGVDHRQVGGSAGEAGVAEPLAAAFGSGGVTLVEVPVEGSPGERKLRARGRLHAAARGVVGDETLRRIRRR
jgi:acetolactate synthase-1/2/3 large subunit